jgi:hypothetical protein
VRTVVDLGMRALARACLERLQASLTVGDQPLRSIRYPTAPTISSATTTTAVTAGATIPAS